MSEQPSKSEDRLTPEALRPEALEDMRREAERIQEEICRKVGFYANDLIRTVLRPAGEEQADE